MALALQSTGRAVFLSAVTTVIGFVSLILTPMAPSKQSEFHWLVELSSLLYTDYGTQFNHVTRFEKPSHDPPKVFILAVRTPIDGVESL